MEEKTRLWLGWKAAGGNAKALEETIGARGRNEVETWGFDFEDIVREGDEFVLHASTQAYQNRVNLHVTDGDGELADILSKYPELTISGIFVDRFGAGYVCQAEQKYEYFRTEGDGTHVDVEMHSIC